MLKEAVFIVFTGWSIGVGLAYIAIRGIRVIFR